ncbi:MAG: hypothetical protein LBT05_06880, partial [Planctomycetaceae bacterium]|nr:hypothetical protein [Planctomycetaceae bacterium]
AGGIEEDDVKELVRVFQNFFTETTVRREAAGNNGADPSLPLFQEPKQPDSLNGPTTVSYHDMKQISEWLKNVKGGQCQNLYEFLGLTPNETTQQLLDKSQKEADRALKIPKTNHEADYLNKISGKCLLYFKNEENRKGYYRASKRFPFDKFCENKLIVFAKKFGKNNNTIWELYQQSIQETVQLGYSQEEADWLVFDFFCNKKKCPHPIPSITETPQPDKSPFPHIKTALSRIKTAVEQLWRNWNTPPETTVVNKTEGQFDSPDLQDFTAVKKKFHSQKSFSVLELSIMFDSLNALQLKKTTLPNPAAAEITALRAAVAEKLAEKDYKQLLFDRALRCYDAVLDYNPYESLARARKNFIENFKSDLFSQLNTLAAQNNAVDCTPIIAELYAKFPTDPETNDYCKKIEKQLADIPLPVKEELQKLINEKQWYKIHQLLSVKQNALPVNYQPVLERAQQILAKTNETFTAIRKTLQENPGLAQTQLYQLKNTISDYPEFDSLNEEFEMKKNHSAELETELQILCKQKHWIHAENQTREFLSRAPIKSIGLKQYVQTISAGVENYQNKLRLWTISLLGLPTCYFFIIVFFALFFPKNSQSISSNAFFSSVLIFSGFYVGLSVLLFALRKKTETPKGMRWYSLLVLCLLVSFSALFLQYNQNILESINNAMREKMQNDDSFNPERFQNTMQYFFAVLSFGSNWFVILGRLLFLHSFIHRAVCREKFYPLGKLFLLSGGMILILLLPEDRLFGLHHNPLFLGIVIWTISCWIVFRDYRKNLDSSFGIDDFKAYLQRRILIAKLRKNKSDLGQISLLETNWYQEIEKTRVRQQRQTAANQPGPSQKRQDFVKNASSPIPQQPPTPPIQKTASSENIPVPPIQKIPVPGAVPVPPITNRKQN